jgi:hypothetical protein
MTFYLADLTPPNVSGIELPCECLEHVYHIAKTTLQVLHYQSGSPSWFYMPETRAQI